MRILILAPNGGVSLSTGGGTRVLLRMAEILAGDLGQEVTVAGYHSLSLEALERLHSVRLGKLGVKLHPGPGAVAYENFRSFPFKLSPYNLLLSRAFGRWVRRAIRDSRPDILWFHDDIPRAALPATGSCRVFLYVHYPLGGRTARLAPPLAYTRTMLEHLDEAMLIRLSKGLIANPTELGSVEVWTNSTVTSNVVRQLWGSPSKIVHPYVDAGVPSLALEKKEKVVLAVGTLSKGKGYHLLIDAFAQARLPGWKLVLVGHSRDAAYSGQLLTQIQRAGLSGHAQIHSDAEPSELERIYQSASIIVNCAAFEPFGIAFVEGMSYGAIPVTLESDFSGCWADICHRGEFGRSFRSVAGLSAQLRALADVELREGEARAAIDRSAFFNRSRVVDALTGSVR